jgi:hypothetical protein
VWQCGGEVFSLSELEHNIIRYVYIYTHSSIHTYMLLEPSSLP